MGNIEQTIRMEIVRLAKREARKLTEPLRGEVKRLKKRTVEQKAQLSALERKLDGMQAGARLKEKTAQAASGEVKGRLSPRLIKALRKRLKLSQQQFAGLLGVSAITIGNWEKGKSAPRPELKAKVLSLRGMGRREAKLLVAGPGGKALK